MYGWRGRNKCFDNFAIPRRRRHVCVNVCVCVLPELQCSAFLSNQTKFSAYLFCIISQADRDVRRDTQTHNHPLTRTKPTISMYVSRMHAELLAPNPHCISTIRQMASNKAVHNRVQVSCICMRTLPYIETECISKIRINSPAITLHSHATRSRQNYTRSLSFSPRRT